MGPTAARCRNFGLTVRRMGFLVLGLLILGLLIGLAAAALARTAPKRIR